MYVCVSACVYVDTKTKTTGYIITRDTIFSLQILPDFAVQFVNSAALLSPNTLHSAASWRCCINYNISKYKEFIVTCNTKTCYIRPLMMTISS